MIAAERPDGGGAVLRRIEDAGGEAAFVQADVSRDAEVEAMVKATLERFGRLLD